MQTLLVRLKPYDPRRGHVVRRFTYRGIKFHEERGWYRVASEVAEYLRAVRQVQSDEHAPLAFDVCTEEEARALDDEEAKEITRSKASDPVETTTTTSETEEEASTPARSRRRGSRSK